MAAKKGGFINEVLTQRELEAKNKPHSLIRSTQEPVAHPVQAVQSDYATENKSKRLNLLLRPSVYEDIKRLANVDSTTPNNLINEALAAYCKQRQADIQKFHEYHGEE